MALTLAPLTVQACATAVVDWLDRELGTQPQKRDVIFIDNVPWLDLRVFTATRDEGNSPYLPGIWSRLSNDPVGTDMVLSDEPFVIELHTRDPTDVSHYVDPEVTTAARPLPWRRLLLFPTETAVIASTYGAVAPNWYTTRWPFRD
jgi:hypothetical protein